MAASVRSPEQSMSSPKMKMPRKRKVDQLQETDNSSEDVSGKRRNTDIYSVAEFKVLMKDPNKKFQALEQFVKFAKAFPESSTYDLVDEYCQSSPECKEIFSVFETGRLKANESRAVLETFESILLRIADDLSKHKSVGKFIVRRLLTSHIATIYLVLYIGNNSVQIKSALRTLTAMVLLGTDTANEVLLQFNFYHANIPPLLNRRDTKDPQDVRTCYVQFLMSFLVIGDNGIIRQLMEAKGVLNLLFHDLRYDKLTVINLILQTMKEKVVENPVISKTMKVRVFNEKTLNELGSVYQWLGPSAWVVVRKSRKKSKAKQKEILGVENTESNEDKESVRELLHEFMISICCSLKMGINFLDKTLGTSKNQNHLLTNLMLKMKSTAVDDLMSELVVEVLKVCPDQLVWYLPSLKESLQPRPSSMWQKTIRLLQKIFSGQSSICPAVKMQGEFTRATLTKMIMNTLLPPKDVWQQVTAALDNENHSVKYEGLHMILIILERLKATLEYCSQPHEFYASQELAEIKLFMIHSLRQLLPDVRALIRCWNSAFISSKGESKKAADAKESKISEDFAEVSETKYLVSLLQVLCAYQTTLPEVFRDHTVDFGALLEGVRAKIHQKEEANDADNDEEDVTMLQLCLLQLLAQSDIRQFSWTKESSGHRTTLYLLLEMTVTVAKAEQFSEAAVALLIKLLIGTGAFSHLEAELQIWIEHLTKLQESEAGQIIEFIEKAILKVLKDPYLYTEKVIDAGAKLSQAGIGEGSLEAFSDAQFDEIMKIDIDLSDMTVASGSHGEDIQLARLPFSPLVPCSLEALAKTEDVSAAVQSYFQGVLKDIVWQQTEPEALCLLLVQQKDNSVIGPSLGPLVQKWLNNDISEYPVTKKEKKAKGILSMTEQSVLDSSILTKIDHLDLEGLTFSQVLPLTSRVLLALRTALMEECNKDVLKVYKNLLIKINQKLQSDEDQQLTSTKDERLSFLDNRQLDIKSLRKIFYKLVLTHPSMKEWFLRSTVLEDVGKSFQLKRRIVTKMITGVMSTMDEEMMSSVTSDLEPYRHQLIKMATTNEPKDKVIASCLKNMTHILDTRQLLEAAESLLTSQCDALIADQCLTDYGQALLALLDKYLSSQSLTSQNEALSSGAFQSVLTVASLVSDFDQLIEKTICTFPSLVTTVDEKYVCHCLQEARDSQIAVLRICLQLSPACRLWFCEWASQEKLKRDQLRNFSLLFQQFLASANNDDVQNQKLAKKIGKVIGKDLATWFEINEPYCYDLVKGLLKWSSQEFVSGIFDKVLEIMELQENADLLNILKVLNNHLSKTSDDQSERIVLACVKCMLVLSANKDQDERSGVLQLLGGICDLLKEKCAPLTNVQEELMAIWPQMTKQLLRHYYQTADTHILLEVLASVIYDGETQVKPDVKTLHNMIISHSAFLDVMLNEENKHILCKEKIVQFLLKLVTLDKSCCDVSHIAVMLGSYSATMKPSDQMLLALMREYERNDCDMNQYKPYLWGAKAVEHHALKQNLNVRLKKQPTMAQVLEGIDPDVMLHSVHHFPLTRSYQKTDLAKDDIDDISTDVYDPLFVLPLFAHLLSPGYVTHCMKFAELHCLGYTVAALSSHDKFVRGAAYHVLHLFYQQIEAARFSSKEILMYFMKLIRNSIETPGAKLTPVVTIFLAKTAAIIIDPKNRLYKAINSFLLVKPKMDVLNVPEFYKLFNSVETQYKFERAWMLTLLRDGLREIADYRIYQRRYIFKMIMAFHDSPLCDENSQKQVLEVLHQACKLKIVAFDLVKNHALLTWITTLISKGPCSWGLVTDMLSSLWLTMLHKRDVASPDAPDLKLKRPCLPIQFTLEMLQVMVHLLMSMRQWMTGEHFRTYLQCLTSVLKHLLITKKFLLGDDAPSDTPKLVDTFVSFPFVLRLLLHWSKISKNVTLEKDIHLVLKQSAGDTVDLVDPEESETREEETKEELDTDGQQHKTVTFLVDVCCILRMRLSESENAAEKQALLFTSDFLVTSLLEIPPDTTRWQQYAYWLRSVLNVEWIRLAYLCNPLGELQMNKLVHFYKTDHEELRMILNNIHITLYQTCLKHKTPEKWYARLCGHFKSAMHNMSKELATGNMQELVTELVLETKSGAVKDGPFQVLLSKF